MLWIRMLKVIHHIGFYHMSISKQLVCIIRLNTQLCKPCLKWTNTDYNATLDIVHLSPKCIKIRGTIQLPTDLCKLTWHKGHNPVAFLCMHIIACRGHTIVVRGTVAYYACISHSMLISLDILSFRKHTFIPCYKVKMW